MATLAIVFISLYFVSLSKMIDLNLGSFFYVMRILDVITWNIPAALPIYMSLVVSNAVIRLKFQNICALNPNTVILAGKVIKNK